MKYPKSIYDDEYRLFVSLLKEYRESKGLSQTALGEQLGADQTYVSKYETLIRRLDFIEFRNVCQAIGISAGEFLKEYEKRVEKK